MSDKRRRRELGDGTDDEDDLDDDARDSVDLDAETEAQRRRDMARIQAGWNQRVDLMQQTITSLQNPTVVRAMQMILNLGLVSPTNEFMDILQLGMRDIEEKQRQEGERRRQRRSRRANPGDSAHRSAYNADGFAADIDAVVRRSQEAGQSSATFGPGAPSRNDDDDDEDRSSPLFVIGGDDEDEDEDDDEEEFDEEDVGRIAALVTQSRRDYDAGRSSFFIDGDDIDEDNEEKKREQARLLSLYQPPRNSAPRHPTILQRLDEIKAREELNPNDAVYQNAMDSIANRIHDFMVQSRNDAVEEDEEQYETESERNRRLISQRADFEWDDVVPPSPIPEDEDVVDITGDNDDDDDDDNSSEEEDGDDE